MIFGQKLTELRRQRGIQQKGMAIMLSVDQSFLSRIEHGHKPPPRPREFIQRVADVLLLTSDEVVDLQRGADADQTLGPAVVGATQEQVRLALTLVENLRRLRPGEIRAIAAILSLQEEGQHPAEVVMN